MTKYKREKLKPILLKMLPPVLEAMDVEAKKEMMTRAQFAREAIKAHIDRVRRNRRAKEKEFSND